MSSHFCSSATIHFRNPLRPALVAHKDPRNPDGFGSVTVDFEGTAMLVRAHRYEERGLLRGVWPLPAGGYARAVFPFFEVKHVAFEGEGE